MGCLVVQIAPSGMLSGLKYYFFLSWKRIFPFLKEKRHKSKSMLWRVPDYALYSPVCFAGNYCIVMTFGAWMSFRRVFHHVSLKKQHTDFVVSHVMSCVHP